MEIHIHIWFGTTWGWVNDIGISLWCTGPLNKAYLILADLLFLKYIIVMIIVSLTTMLISSQKYSFCCCYLLSLSKYISHNHAKQGPIRKPWAHISLDVVSSPSRHCWALFSAGKCKLIYWIQACLPSPPRTFHEWGLLCVWWLTHSQ